MQFMTGPTYNSIFLKILKAGFIRFSWVLALLWGVALAAQSPQLLFRVDQPARFLTMDPLGQAYVVTPQNDLLVYSSKGELRFFYQNFRHGKLGWVDASNPLNILVYYPQYGQVVMLDRTLSEIGMLSLPEAGFWDVPVAGRSADNQIWIYDPVQTAIRKVNIRGDTQVEGQPLSLLLNRPPQPEWIVEQKQEVFLYDPGAGVHVFDPFGQYLKTIPTGEMTALRVWDGHWTFWREGKFYLFYPERQLERELVLPETALSGTFSGGRMLLQVEGGFVVYGID
jgi:hypothetical protein